MKKFIAMLLSAFILSLSACGPKIKSQEDQEVMQGDSLNNPQQGKGEGPVPEEVIK